MSPKKQRIAIAKFCGWKQVEDYPITSDDGEELWVDYGWVHPKMGVGQGEYEPPDYLNDLNAIRAAEKCLLHPQLNKYYDHLVELCGTKGCIIATAVQRAEALLRTLDLWEE